jgi:hypothetical protein
VVFRFAGYRFATTLRSRWGGYLSVVLLLGLVAGVGLGALAGARRTQSSFPAYLASTNPSDLETPTGIVNPLIGSATGYDPALIAKIERLPHVVHVVSASGLNVVPLVGHGDQPANVPGFPTSAGNGIGSDGREGFTQDRLTVVQGRMADPRRADQIEVQTEVAQLDGYHVGTRLRLGVYTNAQTQQPGFGTASVRPLRVVQVTVVALVVLGQHLVEDDVDNSANLAFFTPAFTRPLLGCCSNYTVTSLQVAGGPRYLPQVQRELIGVLPPGFPVPTATVTTVAKAERAIKPESIALGVFGGLALLAALVIAAQVIARQVRMAAGDDSTLRALGADPALILAGNLAGLLGSVVAGALAAVAVALALSPLAPFGPVRPVDPTAGVSVDATVLGFGLLALVVLLGAVAVLLAYRALPHRAARQRAASRAAVANVTGPVTWAALPPSATTGIRFALDPGSGRNAVPVRSAILGTLLAVAVLVTTITFGSSLNTLVSHPRLYGWNWDTILSAGGGSGNAPAGPATRLLDHDRYVGAWAGGYTAEVDIDGVPVPVLAERPGAALQPPILSGHRLERPGQVVLGAVTLAQLHQHVGGTLTESAFLGAPTRGLRIVGTASMPTLGSAGSPHLEMGTGALLSSALISPAARNPFNDPVPGPQVIFVDYRRGARPAAAARSLDVIAHKLSNPANFGVFVGPVQHPAEIVNYRSMGTTPAVLGAALSLGAVVALGLTLVASVRRRRRDLALLKALGFTARQVAGVVAWQSSIAVVVGTVIGVPLGMLAGRALWTKFAQEINAVPFTTVPTVWLAVVAGGALLLAIAIAAIPGRIAARTPVAAVLRAE